MGIPEEILGPRWKQAYDQSNPPTDPKKILDYYFAQRKSGARPLREMKIVLLGPGEAGKTTISNFLRTGAYQSSPRGETLGVELADWTLTDPALKGPVTTHIWDFAGQEDTHGAHAYFLTPRTVYVLVLTGRQDTEEAAADYWLNLVKAHGTEKFKVEVPDENSHWDSDAEMYSGTLFEEQQVTAPVIVCLHQWDNHGRSRPQLDRGALKEKFPFIKAFVETDCQSGRGMAALKEEIAKAVAGITIGGQVAVEQNFPNSWWAVKEALSRMKEPPPTGLGRHYVPYADYKQLCADKGVEAGDIDALAGSLNRLGIALNYADDDRLRETTILNPAWLTDGIYRLLRRAPDDDGVLTQARAEAELADPHTKAPMDPAMVNFLLRLMVRYGLAFELCSDKELGQPPARTVAQDSDLESVRPREELPSTPQADTGPSPTQGPWLVPQRLPDSQPENLDLFWLEADQATPKAGATRLRYTFQVVPKSLVPRFIAKRHLLCPEGRWWRRGIVLELDGARALVRADMAAHTVTVSVLPPADPGLTNDARKDRQQDLAGLIMLTWRDLLRQAGLSPREEMEVAPHLWQPIGGLESAELKKIPELQVATANNIVPVQVTPQLNKLTEPPARDGSWKPKLFISYSHRDERHRERLEVHLAVAKTNGQVEWWHDRMIMPGDVWDDRIKSSLEKADIFVLLATADALASHYIESEEVALALKLHKEGRLKLVTVVVGSCAVRNHDRLRHFQMLPKDAKPIAKFSPRDDGWAAVAEGIVKVCLELIGWHKAGRP